MFVQLCCGWILKIWSASLVQVAGALHTPRCKADCLHVMLFQNISRAQCSVSSCRFNDREAVSKVGHTKQQRGVVLEEAANYVRVSSLQGTTVPERLGGFTGSRGEICLALSYVPVSLYCYFQLSV